MFMKEYGSKLNGASITESDVEQEYIELMDDGWFNEFTFLDESRIEKKFALIPHQCVVTKKWIWLESAIRARRKHIVPGGSRDEDRWYLPTEYTMLVLKGGF